MCQPTTKRPTIASTARMPQPEVDPPASIFAEAVSEIRTVTTSGDFVSTGAFCNVSALRDAYDRELFEAPIGWRVSGARLTLTTRGGDTFDYQRCRRRQINGGAEDYACLGPSR